MQRMNLEPIPADFVSTKAAANDMAALQALRTNQPDVFLHQLTELARSGDQALLAKIEAEITKEDRSHYLLMHAINGDRQLLQDEYDLVPANRKLAAKLLVAEGSARGGHFEFAHAIAATFPSGYDIEDDDEKISDIMARIAILRGYAQNKTLKQNDSLALLNTDLHKLVVDLDKQDYDRADRDNFQLYAYEHIFKGFYLAGLLEDLDQVLTVMVALRYISLRDLLAVEYDRYQKHVDEYATAKLGESIIGEMLSKHRSFTEAKTAMAQNKNLQYAKSMHLFAYHYTDRKDPLREVFDPALIPETPSLK